jgi:hypothetical protein
MAIFAAEQLSGEVFVVQATRALAVHEAEA